MGRVIAAAVVSGVLIAIYGAHRLALWAEERGWIYYRRKDRPAPLPMGMLEEIYQPSIEHMVVEMSDEAIRADHDESGAERDD
jgi:hypothetical protein